MLDRDPKKFDPGNAAALDAPEREDFLPSSALVALLELAGSETVVDYGAGTGTVSAAVAAALDGGRVLAVDESDVMLDRLRSRSLGSGVVPLLIKNNATGLPAGIAARVVAVNLLHEVRGETALREMRRLLSADGFLLMVDWRRGVERSFGPPDELLYSRAEAQDELREAGFRSEPLEVDFPFHFALRAYPA